MNSENKNETPARHSPFRNWMSLAGVVLTLGSFFSFLLLFVLDSLAHFSNPYVGILTYMVAPGFGVMGICLMILGFWIGAPPHCQGRRNARLAHRFFPSARPEESSPFSSPAAVVFLLVSAVGSYQTYHYTESVQFCGEACHGVMKPERVPIKMDRMRALPVSNVMSDRARNGL